MRVGRYIYNALSNHPAVKQLVGDRIYPVFAPQDGAMPCIVYTVKNEPHAPSKTSAGNLDKADVTFHVWAEARDGQNAYDLLDAIDSAIRVALDHTDNAAGGVSNAFAHYVASRDGRDDGLMFYLREIEYIIIHK